MYKYPHSLNTTPNSRFSLQDLSAECAEFLYPYALQISAVGSTLRGTVGTRRGAK